MSVKLSYTRFAVWVGFYPSKSVDILDNPTSLKRVNDSMFEEAYEKGHEWPDLPEKDFCNV